MSEFKCPSCGSKIKGWHYMHCSKVERVVNACVKQGYIPLPRREREMAFLAKQGVALFVLVAAFIVALVWVNQ